MSPVIGMRHLLSRHVIYRGDVVVVPGRGEAPGPTAC
jgi:hypothetical protein